jgi:hypothetical protein
VMRPATVFGFTNEGYLSPATFPSRAANSRETGRISQGEVAGGQGTRSVVAAEDEGRDSFRPAVVGGIRWAGVGVRWSASPPLCSVTGTVVAQMLDRMEISHCQLPGRPAMVGIVSGCFPHEPASLPLAAACALPIGGPSPSATEPDSVRSSRGLRVFRPPHRGHPRRNWRSTRPSWAACYRAKSAPPATCNGLA